jgi:hypothetical protein
MEQHAISHLSGDSRSALFSRYNPFDSTSIEEYGITVGFTLEDIGQMITSGKNPQVYEAYRGTFTEDAISNAVKTGPLNDQLVTEQYGNQTFYRWGEDNLVNLEQRSSVRPLGKGHRLALVDDFVFWMTGTEGIESMLDSYNNKQDSLADVEEFKLLAEELEELDVTHAYFSFDTRSYAEIKEWLELAGDAFEINQNQQQCINESIEETPLLKPYSTFATGAGLDNNGYYMVVVLLNPDEDTARQNAELLKQRINDTKSIWQGYEWMKCIESMNIESEGKITAVILYGDFTEFWWERFEKLNPGVYEPLLLHE